MLQRFLDPGVLAGIASLDLVAKTVVEGFIAGLHRSPDFGFSQEFAEYRAYAPGDDLRYVDWNVFARTERCYLKRYRGETNTAVTVLLDASASMGFGSRRIVKLDYARYLAASLFYLANRQRDAAGLIVFDDEVRDVVAPSSRHGQLSRLLHALECARAGRRTDYARPFLHLLDHLRRRGIVVVISDFYAPPGEVVRTMAPVRFRGSELILFHVLDPEELRPAFDQPLLLVDAETRERMEVAPEYARREYRARIEAHVAALREQARQAGMDYYLAETGRPLDEALREYLSVRQGRM
ncbi:MAG: DUF58 domain-containing protein [Bryobacteraceae bacterium]